MERLFRRIGVQAHRAGPAQCIDGRMVVACWIDIDNQTLSALGVEVAHGGIRQLVGPVCCEFNVRWNLLDPSS
jgi:acyl homoserine lactone synthase